MQVRVLAEIVTFFTFIKSYFLGEEALVELVECRYVRPRVRVF